MQSYWQQNSLQKATCPPLKWFCKKFNLPTKMFSLPVPHHIECGACLQPAYIPPLQWLLSIPVHRERSPPPSGSLPPPADGRVDASSLPSRLASDREISSSAWQHHTYVHCTPIYFWKNFQLWKQILLLGKFCFIHGTIRLLVLVRIRKASTQRFEPWPGSPLRQVQSYIAKIKS